MSFLKKLWRIIWKTFFLLFILSILSVILFRFVPVPFTSLMLIRCAQQVADGKTLKLKKSWESIDNISPNLVLAVVASEDNNFLDHHGFDLEAIGKAMKYNDKKKGNKVRGASTISQQTAKNVFLWPGRSYIRKGFEAYFTLLIEFIWGKKRIMEVYLNVIEMGDGIYGAESASREYFRKSASALTRQEAARIALVLPNPLRWTPSGQTPYTIKREAWILWNMNNIEEVKWK